MIKYLRAMGHLTKSLIILNCFMLSLISVMLSWFIGNCLLSLFIISWFVVMVAAGLLKHGFMVLFLCLCCYGFVKPVDCIAYLLVVSVQIKCGIASLFWFYFCSVYFISGIRARLTLEKWVKTRKWELRVPKQREGVCETESHIATTLFIFFQQQKKTMASENFVQPAIPHFDGHYDYWSMLMENFLRSKEYWQVVSGGIAEPAMNSPMTDAQKTEIEGQRLKDLKTKNYLFQAIDHSILETILCKDTSQ